MFEYCHARVFLCNLGEVYIFLAWALDLSFETGQDINIKQSCSYGIHKHFCNIFSCGGMGSINTSALKHSN